MTEDLVINIIEWISAMGYIQKVAGNWVDDHNDTVARDTAQLISLYCQRHRQEQEPEDVVPIKKVRRQYKPRDWNGGQVGRKPLPNTLDRYRLAKARKPSECQCCTSDIERGSMKWASHNSDICLPCFRKWKEVGGILERHSDYQKRDAK